MTEDTCPQQLALEFPPVKLCACGCGRATPRILHNHPKVGQAKGDYAAYCRGHCPRQKRATISIADRFWAKVVRDTTLYRCWVWTKATDGHGYGQIAREGSHTPIKAHRLSWELAHGAIPDGLWVLHKCDNTRCVRPSHLFLGTAEDNNRDMARKHHAKGKFRVFYGDDHWTRRYPGLMSAIRQRKKTAVGN